MRRTARLILAASLIVATNGFAQTLPQNVRLIIPYAASGPADLVARMVTDKIAQQGRLLLSDNRPGADGAIAAVAVAKGPTDGSQFLFSGAGLLTLNQHMQKDLPFDPEKDFVPVVGVAYADTVLVVSPALPVKNLKEFIAYAKKAPKPIALASGGTGTTTHLYLELLKDSAGFEMLHVPYKGSGPALVDVISGQTLGTVTALSITQANINAGKLKALALVGTQRSRAAPEIPTFAEQGIKGLEIVSWWGIVAPRGTGKEAVAEMERLFVRALEDTEIKARLQVRGMTPWPLRSADLGKLIVSESARWKKLVTDRKLGPQ